LILGADIAAIKDRDEYLKRQAEAQSTVPEADLVRHVRDLLVRHNLG
jgi:histidyl-tRNA synthetase